MIFWHAYIDRDDDGRRIDALSVSLAANCEQHERAGERTGICRCLCRTPPADNIKAVMPDKDHVDEPSVIDHNEMGVLTDGRPGQAQRVLTEKTTLVAADTA